MRMCACGMVLLRVTLVPLCAELLVVGRVNDNINSRRSPLVKESESRHLGGSTSERGSSTCGALCAKAALCAHIGYDLDRSLGFIVICSPFFQQKNQLMGFCLDITSI